MLGAWNFLVNFRISHQAIRIEFFVSQPSKSITGAALLLGTATLVSRIVALFRDRTFAHFYGGSSPVMDAYYAAFKIPDLIYGLLIAGALTAGFIPIFTKLFYESEDKSKAWRLANNVISIIAAALIILGILGAIFAPFLVKIVAPGFTGERLTLVTEFTRIMLISPLLLGISMVLGGILQSLRQFALYSIAPIFYNLGIIFGAVFLTTYLGPAGLAWGVVLGSFLHLIIQLIGAVKNNYRWRWHFDLGDGDTRTIGRLMIPRTLGLAMTQINTVIITILASLLPLGSLTIYNYANNLQMVPSGIIGIPFALAAFPLLSRKALLPDHAEFKTLIISTLRQVIFLIAPLSVCFLLLRAQIVRVILGTGEFDWSATTATANALGFFSISIFAQALIPLFARSFYSLNNTKTPFLIGVVTEIISITGAILLMKPYGVAGLALASSLGIILNLVLLVYFLEKKIDTIVDRPVFLMLSKVVLASMIMGVAVQYVKNILGNSLDLDYFWGIFSQGMAAASVGILMYFISCRLLNVEEVIHFQSSLKKRWMRLWNIGEGMDEAEKL